MTAVVPARTRTVRGRRSTNGVTRAAATQYEVNWAAPAQLRTPVQRLSFGRHPWGKEPDPEPGHAVRRGDDQHAGHGDHDLGGRPSLSTQDRVGSRRRTIVSHNDRYSSWCDCSRHPSAVLDAAEDLFFTSGITGTGVDKVANQANVAIATLYKYSGSKDNLLREVLARRLSMWSTTGTPPLPPPRHQKTG